MLIVNRPNLYDYLKLYAIITMIIDHLWFFLFPEIPELRVIGRVSFPLFFLLIGRNGSHRISWSLLWSAVIIQSILWITSYLYGYSLRQINILSAAVLCKLLLWVRSWFLINQKVKKRLLAGVVVLCMLAASGTHQRIEYGTMTLGMVLMGRAMRLYKNDRLYLVSIGLVALYGLIIVNYQFWFTTTQRSIIVWWWISWMISMWVLSYTNFSMRSPSVHRNNIITWVSRYALQIYIVHFVLLLLIVTMRRYF